MIDLKTLRQLIKLMQENDLTEIDLRDKDEQVSMKRGGGVAMVPMAHHPPALPVAAAAQPPAQAAAPTSTPVAGADEGLLKITSPMVGTFYSSPSPDADPFVRPGTRIGADSVVCLLEAMKVFNEIKAEISGTIERVLVTSGQTVEFGQTLFLVRPD